MIDREMRAAEIIKSIPQDDAQISIDELFEVCSSFTHYCNIHAETICRVGTGQTKSSRENSKEVSPGIVQDVWLFRASPNGHESHCVV